MLLGNLSRVYAARSLGADQLGLASRAGPHHGDEWMLIKLSFSVGQLGALHRFLAAAHGHHPMRWALPALGLFSVGAAQSRKRFKGCEDDQGVAGAKDSIRVWVEAADPSLPVQGAGDFLVLLRIADDPPFEEGALPHLGTGHIQQDII